jgi:putative tricarboxylic transport membrane protein
LSVAIGLLLGAVGLDTLSATPRLGIIPKLGMLEGIDLIAFLLGAFALPEIFINSLPRVRKESANIMKEATGFYGPHLTLAEVKDSLKAFFTGTTIGTIVGIIPGLGASAAAFLSYGINKQVYKGKSASGVKFGEGAVPGVVAAESANSAVSGANYLPLLTLGIPGSATAALILAALMLHGVTPGPGVFAKHGSVLYAFFVALLLGNFLNIFYANVLVKPLTWLLKRNPNIVYPVVLLLCFSGVYSINNRVMDLGIMVAIGFLAFLMKRGNIPIAPMVIGFILSRMVEQNFRLSLAVTKGNYSIFLSSPINKVMFVLCIIGLAAVVYQRVKGIGYEDSEEI